MRKNIFNKKRNILLIMMLTTVLTFGGCGSKKETTTTEEIVSETETTEELTTESTEVIEPEKETIELSAEEDLFIVVDPEVIISDNTEVSSVEVSEESKQASNEAPITETVTTSQPSVETSQVNSVDNETYTPSDYTAPPASEGTQSTCSHAYGYGEINCMLCGAPHTHDWKIVVQTNTGVEVTPDEDFCCHSGWYFDTYEELRAHMDIPNVHGMVYLNDGSNGVTSVAPDYTGEVDFYACCHGWANCAGDGEGERIEYEVTQEVQFCKLCGVRGEATDIGERVILLHTYDD